MRNRVFILTLAVLLLLPLAHAGAQTMASTPPPSTPPPSTPPPPSGPSAFEQLSPGGQKIALALYQAQPRPHRRGDGTIGTGTGGSTPTRLTLDQIAQRKQDGQGWGRVFKGMKAEGLVTQRNLGQVVSSYNHNQRHHNRHHYDRGHDRHHGRDRHDGDRHERYARRDGHDRHDGYQRRDGHRTHSRDGHEGRGYEGRGSEGRRYEGRSYESRGSEGRRYEGRSYAGRGNEGRRSYQGGGGEQGSRVGAGSSRSTYTASTARGQDGGRGYQAGSSPRQGGGSGNGHSK